MDTKNNCDTTNQKKHDTDYNCPHYEALHGTKRCCHYVDGGSCSRPDELLCVEWLKRNKKSKQAVEQSQPPLREAEPTDLFGEPLPKPKKPKHKNPKKQCSVLELVPKPEAENAKEPTIDVDQLPGLTVEDIASFKALGVEVCLKNETFGEVWLVGAYTGQDRREITPEHVATISRAAAAFPGSTVASFETNSQKDKEIL